MSKLVEVFAKQDAPENPEKYHMKAHILLSSVVYNIVPFYDLFIVHTHFSSATGKNNLKKRTPLGLQTPPNVCLYKVIMH
jgi:hypothetical protein